MSIPIKLGDGTIVGHVKEDTYYTSRNENTIFRKYNSLNIGFDVIRLAKEAGATKVEIKLTIGDKKEIFVKSIAEIETCGKYNWEYALKLNWLREIPKPKCKYKQKQLFEEDNKNAEVA